MLPGSLRALLIALPTLFVATACAALLGLNQDLPGAQADAARPDASDNDDAGQPCRSDAGVVASEGVFVSSSGGRDDNAGSKEQPFKTVARAFAERGTNLVINVCVGTYPEGPFDVPPGFTLRGGYDCQTWTRGPDFGKCGRWASAGLSVLRRGAGAGTGSMVNLQSGSTLEGFEVHGVGATALSSAGDNTVSESRIEGDSSDAGVPSGDAGAPSSGIRVLSGSIEITRSSVHGGAGVSSEGLMGSVAIISNTNATTIVVRESELHAGAGSCAARACTAATGAFVAAGTLQMFDSDVFADRPARPLPPGTYGFVGITIGEQAKAHVENLRMKSLPRQSNDEEDATQYIGVDLQGELTMLRSRVDLSALGVRKGSTCYGVIVGKTSTTVLRDNAILASCSNSTTNGYGVRVEGNVTLSNNTIVLADSSTAWPIWLREAGQARLINNVLIAAAKPDSAAVRLESCDAGVSDTRNNAVGTSSAFSSACSDGGASATFDPDAGNIYGAGEAVPDIRSVTLFASGWRPDPAKPGGCNVARGGAFIANDLDGGIAVDIVGIPRGARPSMGAWELPADAGCP
jgi:hypothetical protein